MKQLTTEAHSPCDCFVMNTGCCDSVIHSDPLKSIISYMLEHYLEKYML